MSSPCHNGDVTCVAVHGPCHASERPDALGLFFLQRPECGWDAPSEVLTSFLRYLIFTQFKMQAILKEKCLAVCCSAPSRSPSPCSKDCNGKLPAIKMLLSKESRKLIFNSAKHPEVTWLQTPHMDEKGNAL
eukprot:1160015-Pelagomonas_calceolata.AAC.7